MTLSSNNNNNQSLIKVIKFAFVGGLNTVIDFTVLNSLILLFGMGTNGVIYVIFKSISFIAAMINSYVLNKRWVFKKNIKTSETVEKLLFFIISAVGFLLNVFISTVIFILATHNYLLNENLAANIGALCGSAFVFIWNFFGYKLIVFKDYKKDNCYG